MEFIYLIIFYRTGATDHPSSKKHQKLYHPLMEMDFSSNFTEKNIQAINSVKFLEILSLTKHKNFHVKNYLFLLLLMIPPRNVSMQKHFFRKILSPGGVFQVYLLPKFNPRSSTGSKQTANRSRISFWRQINHLWYYLYNCL